MCQPATGPVMTATAIRGEVSGGTSESASCCDLKAQPHDPARAAQQAPRPGPLNIPTLLSVLVVSGDVARCQLRRPPAGDGPIAGGWP